MNIKRLTLSFLACAGLAACTVVKMVPHTVVCKDNEGKVTFEGYSYRSLQGSSRSSHYAKINATSGHTHEQIGGVCTSLSVPNAPYSMTCKDNQGHVTFQGQANDGLEGGDHVYVQTIDGRAHEQMGGVCTSRYVADTHYEVTCKDNQHNVTFAGRSLEGLRGDDHFYIVTTDQRKFEQYGGMCVASKNPALKPN